MIVTHCNAGELEGKRGMHIDQSILYIPLTTSKESRIKMVYPFPLFEEIVVMYGTSEFLMCSTCQLISQFIM